MSCASVLDILNSTTNAKDNVYIAGYCTANPGPECEKQGLLRASLMDAGIDVTIFILANAAGKAALGYLAERTAVKEAERLAAEKLAAETAAVATQSAANAMPRLLANAKATLPDGMTPAQFGELAGFQQGLTKSAIASTEATVEILASLRSAGVSQEAVANFGAFYSAAAIANSSNFSAVHRAALLANILKVYR